jgi:hypothetical protein
MKNLFLVFALFAAFNLSAHDEDKAAFCKDCVCVLDQAQEEAASDQMSISCFACKNCPCCDGNDYAKEAE